MFRALLKSAALAAFAAVCIAPAPAIAAISATMTRAGELTLNPTQDDAEYVIVDRLRGYAYLAVSASPVQVLKIRLATAATPAAIVGTLVFNTGENGNHTMALDETGGFLYVPTTGSPTIIVKVAVGEGDTDPTRVGEVTLPGGFSTLYQGAHDPLTNTVYFCAVTGAPGRVAKIAGNGPAEPPTLVGVLELEAGEQTLHGLAIDPIRGIGWTSPDVAPGRIVEFQLGAPAEIPVRTSAHLFPTGTDSLRTLAYDPLTQQLYGATSGPGPVQVDVSGTNREFRGQISGGTATAVLHALDINPLLGIALTGTDLGASEIVTQYALGSDTKGLGIRGTLTLEPDDQAIFRNLAIDPDNLFAYLPTDNTTPAKVVIVQLQKGTGVDLAAEIGKFSAATKKGKSRVKAQATIRNVSTTPAGPFFVRSYLSRDRVLSADDILIGKERFVKSLAPGKSRKAPASGSLTAITPGTYYIITVADPQDLNDDAFRTNNVAVSGPIQL